MILPRYRVAASLIPGAGKGLFLDEDVAAGRLITAPDDIRRIYKWSEVLAMPDAQELLGATVRWFEDRYTVTPEWPDECYINPFLRSLRIVASGIRLCAGRSARRHRSDG